MATKKTTASKAVKATTTTAKADAKTEKVATVATKATEKVTAPVKAEATKKVETKTVETKVAPKATTAEVKAEPKKAEKVVLRVGSIFSNCGFMSLPLQKAILGNDGVFYGAIYVAVFNIFIWTYGLVAMSGDKKELSLKKLIANPGIVGVVIAILLWVFHIQLPSILYSPIDYLGALNTPIPMIIIGCQLANTSLKSMLKTKEKPLAFIQVV